MNDRLFVYGTLRPGCSNEHARMLAASTRHIGSARVQGQLFRVTHYPALGPPLLPEDWVTGDLFEGVAPALFAHLDHYEGAEYTRVLVEAVLNNGPTLTTNVYLYALPLDNLQLIRSGDWLSCASQPT